MRRGRQFSTLSKALVAMCARDLINPNADFDSHLRRDCHKPDYKDKKASQTQMMLVCSMFNSLPHQLCFHKHHVGVHDLALIQQMAACIPSIPVCDIARHNKPLCIVYNMEKQYMMAGANVSYALC